MTQFLDFVKDRFAMSFFTIKGIGGRLSLLLN